MLQLRSPFWASVCVRPDSATFCDLAVDVYRQSGFLIWLESLRVISRAYFPTGTTRNAYFPGRRCCVLFRTIAQIVENNCRTGDESATRITDQAGDRSCHAGPSTIEQ
jgi:hypothetical protein